MEYLELKTRVRNDKKGSPIQMELRYREDGTKAWSRATKYMYVPEDSKKAKAIVAQWEKEEKAVYTGNGCDNLNKIFEEGKPIYAANGTAAKRAQIEWVDWFKAKQLKATEEAKKAVELAIKAKEENAPSNQYVSDYVDQYITNYEAIQAVEPATIKGYRTSAKYIHEFFSNVRLCDLTATQVQEFETALVSRGLSSSTVGKAHRLLKQVLKHATKLRIITWNPVDAVKPPKRKSTEPNALDAKSRAIVADYIATHEASSVVTGVALALFAGLHSAECCGLKWVDVDLDNAQVRVTESIGIAEGGMYTKEPKNEKRRRTIDIPPQLVEVLRRRYELMQEQADSVGVRLDRNVYVLSYDLEHYYNPSNLSKAWKQVSETLGVCGIRAKAVRFHDLRHTYATVAIASGVDVKTVSSMLGHANEYMTLHVYASSDPDAKKQAAAKIAKAYEQQAQVIKFKQASNE